MDRRVVISLAMLLGASILAFSFPKCAVAETISKSEYGFSVDVPCTGEKTTMSGSNMEFVDIFICNGMAYQVGVAKAQGRSTASGEIDEVMSFLYKMGSYMGDMSKRFYQSRQGVPFKGISVTGRYMKSGTSLDASVGEGKAHLAMYAAPLNDRTGMILLVGVIGPSGRLSEIDSAASSMAGSVFMQNLPAPGSKSSSGTSAAGPIAPSKPFNDLKKGEIELVGVVDSLEKNAKKFNMLAVQAAAFGVAPAFLNPARLKMVMFDSLPDGIKEGSAIVVVGPNSGSGKPIKASSIVILTNDMMVKKDK